MLTDRFFKYESSKDLEVIIESLQKGKDIKPNGTGKIFITDQEIVNKIQVIGIPIEKDFRDSPAGSGPEISGHSIHIGKPYNFSCEKLSGMPQELQILACVASILSNSTPTTIPKSLAEDKLIKTAIYKRSEQILSIRRLILKSEDGNVEFKGYKEIFFYSVLDSLDQECKNFKLSLTIHNYAPKGNLGQVDKAKLDLLSLNFDPSVPENIKSLDVIKGILPDISEKRRVVKIKQITEFFKLFIDKLKAHTSNPVSIQTEPKYPNINVYVSFPSDYIKNDVLEILDSIGLKPANRDKAIPQLTDPRDSNRSLCNRALVFTNLKPQLNLNEIEGLIMKKIENLETRQNESNNNTFLKK